MLRNACQRSGAIGHRRNHFHPRGFQHGLHPGQQERMIVRDQYPHHAADHRSGTARCSTDRPGWDSTVIRPPMSATRAAIERG